MNEGSAHVGFRERVEGVVSELELGSITALHCLLSRVCRQLFHIPCPVFGLFTEGRRVQHQLLHHERKLKSLIPSLFLFPLCIPHPSHFIWRYS